MLMELCATLGEYLDLDTLHNLCVTKVISLHLPPLSLECVSLMAYGVELLLSVSLTLLHVSSYMYTVKCLMVITCTYHYFHTVPLWSIAIIIFGLGLIVGFCAGFLSGLCCKLLYERLGKGEPIVLSSIVLCFMKQQYRIQETV